MSGESTDPGTIARVEQDGRVLSGGTDAAQLEETMERHAPPEKTPIQQPQTGESTTTPADASAAPAVASTDKPSRGRQRFSDLARERDEARKVADEAKAERERIAKEYETFKASQTKPAAEPATPKEPQKAKTFPSFEEWTKANMPPGADPDWYAYDEAKFAWRMEQQRAADREHIRGEIEAERAAREFQTTRQTVYERGCKAYPDYDALVKAHGANVQMAMDRIQFIVQHPQSEHIQYAVLKDAALAKRLDAASDYEFGAIVASLVPSEKPAKPAASTWTPPPAPHPAVGASSPTTAKASSELAKEGNFDAYRAKRASERGVKARY